MSIRKPIIKVTRRCSECKGTGNKIIKTKGNITFYGGAKFITGKNCIIDCPKCRGLCEVDVKQKDPKFKKYYQKELEEQIAYLTTKYRNAKTEAFDIGEELRKYCKELDKVVNK